MTTARFREATPEDRKAARRALVLFLLGIVVTSPLVSMLEWPRGMMLWLGLVLAGTVLVSRWNANHLGYRCLHCGHEFTISMLTELTSPHGSENGGWRYLRCPRCDRKSRAKALVKEPQRST